MTVHHLWHHPASLLFVSLLCLYVIFQQDSSPAWLIKMPRLLNSHFQIFHSVLWYNNKWSACGVSQQSRAQRAQSDICSHFKTAVKYEDGHIFFEEYAWTADNTLETVLKSFLINRRDLTEGPLSLSFSRSFALITCRARIRLCRELREMVQFIDLRGRSYRNTGKKKKKRNAEIVSSICGRLGSPLWCCLCVGNTELDVETHWSVFSLGSNL